MSRKNSTGLRPAAAGSTILMGALSASLIGGTAHAAEAAAANAATQLGDERQIVVTGPVSPLGVDIKWSLILERKAGDQK